MSLTIENLPLYWRFIKKIEQHQKIPEALDFTFAYDPELFLYIEPRETSLLKILENIYIENANIGYMIDGNNLANTYGSEYLLFLRSILGDLSKRKIVDVGCGGCVMLEKLMSEGASVLGVDPSPVAQWAAQKKGIPLIPSFLGPDTLTGYYPDAIIQMDVLEHISDPVELLRHEAKAITSDGKIIINVPNCEPSILLGDISMAIHQHVNMFTRRSLARVVEAAGLYVEEMRCSQIGSALFCVASKARINKKFASDDFIKFDNAWDTFQSMAMDRIERFRRFFSCHDFYDIGYFIFQRSLPYLCAIHSPIDGRFFDNNSLWHGNYLDGIPA